ncbi:MAG: DsrE family protein [Methanomassiliicoccales archaeon]|nr:DsrE family protein [Methanomassiliicoccales archaeon]
MRICMLLMRTPTSEEDKSRIFGVLRGSQGKEVSIYLLGDGVLCARKGQSPLLGGGVEDAIRSGAEVLVGSRDLRARGIPISELMDGLEVAEDLEGSFIDDAMEHADRVITW